MPLSVITVWRAAHRFNYAMTFCASNLLNKSTVSSLYKCRIVSQCRGCQQLANTISYESKYSQKEQDILLEFFSTASEEELVRFNVSRVRAHKLRQYVKRKGKFNNLSDVLEVDGFGIRVLERMCNSILYPDADDSPGGSSVAMKKHVKIVAPTFTEEQRQELKSAVGLYLTASSLSWAHLDRFGNLTEWDKCSIEFGNGKKINHATLFETVYSIRTRLPPASAYVLEGSQSMLPQPPFFSLHIQKAQIQAMLVALLNTNYATLQRHSVFELKSTCVPRLFGLRIGTERVSGQAVVSDVLQGLECVYPYSRIEVSDFTKSRYEDEEPASREALSQALLITMTFFDLVVHRKPHSLKLVGK